MAIDFETDLAEMLSTDNHGTVVTVPATSATFNAIYNNEYFRQDVGEVGFDTTEQVIYATDTDVASLVKGDLLAIGGVYHTVATIEPDGTGLTRLVLHDRKLDSDLDAMLLESGYGIMLENGDDQIILE